MPKLLLNFYLTVSIPVAFMLNLLITVYTQEIFPVFWLPIMSYLSRPAIRMFFLIISIMGAGLWLWSFFSLRRHFAVLPKQYKSNQMIHTGPYKYFHHPMYLGIFLTFAGLSLAVLSVPGLLFTLAVTTPLNIFRAYQESKLMIKK